MARLDMPRTIAECGIDKEEFRRKNPIMVERAFADQCTIPNPRFPLIGELEEIYRQAYGPGL